MTGRSSRPPANSTVSTSSRCRREALVERRTVARLRVALRGQGQRFAAPRCDAAPVRTAPTTHRAGVPSVHARNRWRCVLSNRPGWYRAVLTLDGYRSGRLLRKLSNFMLVSALLWAVTDPRHLRPRAGPERGRRCHHLPSLNLLPSLWFCAVCSSCTRSTRTCLSTSTI